MTDWADERAALYLADHSTCDTAEDAACLAALLRGVRAEAIGDSVDRLAQEPAPIADATLRRWARMLTPGQADLCRELLKARARLAKLEAVVAAARALSADVLPPPHPPHHIDDAAGSVRVIRHDRARALWAALDVLDAQPQPPAAEEGACATSPRSSPCPPSPGSSSEPPSR